MNLVQPYPGCLSAPFTGSSPAGARRLLRSVGAARRHGFTLIELILVLTLLAILTSLATPSLSSFFRGRALDSEARQLLSLTHAAQSRAVSEGFPMLLWIDSQGHDYGVVEEASSQNGDPKAEEFAFDEKLQIEAVGASPLPVNGRSLPAIRFLPDGTIDEGSASTVRMTAPSGETLWLVRSANHPGYEIRNTDK